MRERLLQVLKNRAFDLSLVGQSGRWVSIRVVPTAEVWGVVAELLFVGLAGGLELVQIRGDRGYPRFAWRP